jgi:hypothetical protein
MSCMTLVDGILFTRKAVSRRFVSCCRAKDERSSTAGLPFGGLLCVTPVIAGCCSFQIKKGPWTAAISNPGSERIDQFVHGRSLQRHSGLSPVAPALNQLDCDKRLPPRSAATARRLSKQPTRAVFRTRIAATAVQCDTCAGGPWQS